MQRTDSKASTTLPFLYKILFFKIESAKNHVTKLLQKSAEQPFWGRKYREKRTFFMENPFKTRDFTLKKRPKQAKFNLKPSYLDVHEDEKHAITKKKTHIAPTRKNEKQPKTNHDRRRILSDRNNKPTQEGCDSQDKNKRNETRNIKKQRQ